MEFTWGERFFHIFDFQRALMNMVCSDYCVYWVDLWMICYFESLCHLCFRYKLTIMCKDRITYLQQLDYAVRDQTVLRLRMYFETVTIKQSRPAWWESRRWNIVFWQNKSWTYLLLISVLCQQTNCNRSGKCCWRL